MTSLVAWVVLVPALTAVSALLLWRSAIAQRLLGVVGGGAHLVCAVSLLLLVERDGTQAVQMGGWPAPFGITLVADTLSAIMAILGAAMGLAVAIYSLADIDERRSHFGYTPLLQVLLMGVSGAFVTGDVFNLYVFFEVMLIASFVLLSVGGGRAQLVGSLHYVVLNLLSSVLFLTAAGLLYGIAGTLNMADLHRALPVIASDNPTVVSATGALLLLSFAVKSGLFPVYFWLPASYHTPPSAVSAIFAGLLTKVGVYALVRACTLVLPVQGLLFEIILVLAGLTIALGVLGAVSQFEMRRILGFHIISQIGYMVLGLGLMASPDPSTQRLALAATVFYIAHHILVKTNLYLLAGTVARLCGSFELARLGGLAAKTPWLAVLFLIPALSLAGIPPLSGFWAKLAVIKAGLAAEQYVAVSVAVLAGLLTLLSMTKIWSEAFWKPDPNDRSLRLDARRLVPLLTPVVALCLGTVAIGLVPEPLFGLATRAADQLLDPSDYLRAVLGSRP